MGWGFQFLMAVFSFLAGFGTIVGAAVLFRFSPGRWAIIGAVILGAIFRTLIFFWISRIVAEKLGEFSAEIKSHIENQTES